MFPLRPFRRFFLTLALLIASGTAAFAGRIYDVYLIAGQSNADGRGSVSDLTGPLADYAAPQSGVRLYYVNPTNSDPLNPTHRTGWVDLAPGYSVGPGFSGTLPSNRFGFELSLGRALATRDPSRSIAFIKVSRGGTNLAQDWDPDGNANYMWQTFARAIPDALAALTAPGDQARICGVFWHQGESDGGNPTYQADLTRLIEATRTLTARPDLPFALGELERDHTTPTVTGRTYQLAAMAAVAAADSHTLLVSSDGLQTYDGTHFTSASYITFGERFAAAMLGRANTPPSINLAASMSVELDTFRPWTPAQLSPAAAAWFDAADSTTLDVSGTAVSVWADKSGRANHAAQPTASLRPTVGTATLGGLPTVSFRIGDGTQKQFLSAAHHASLNLDASGGANVFAVFRHLGFANNGSTSVNAPLAKGNLLLADPAYGIRLSNTQSVGFKAGTDVLLSASSPDSANQALLFAGTRDDTTLTSTLHLHGSLALSSPHSATLASDNAHPLFLGRDPSSSRYTDIDFGEILILGGALSASARQQIEGYLAHKWDLASSLPSTHPHRSLPPGEFIAVADLQPTVTDTEGDSLTHSWTTVAGPAPVSFGDASAASTAVVFTQAGTYTLRLTSSDGLAATSADTVVTVAPRDAFAAWVNASAPSGSLAFDGDANHDGLADGLAWLLGAPDPTTPAGALLPIPTRDGDAIDLTFTVLTPDQRNSSVVEIQYSSDLHAWTSVPVPESDGLHVHGPLRFSVSSAGQHLHVRATLALPSTAARLFFRLRGTRP